MGACQVKMEITLKTIGFAKNREQQRFGGWSEVVTDLVLDEKYKEGLIELKDYSHVIVIYWMHEVTNCDMRAVPQGKAGQVPEVGIFACRCPQRPNPIGVTTIRILSVRGSVVTVKGLDVVSNTPILDLKPYTPQYDIAQEATVPEWVNKLDY
jgi:tRNA-Thr(GGU) m(6)t(6)A37 methyltransferase TsaA